MGRWIGLRSVVGMNYYGTKSTFVIRRVNLVSTRTSPINFDVADCEIGDASYLVEFDTLSNPKYENLWAKREATGGKEYKTLTSARRAFRAKAIKHAMARPEKYRVEVVEIVWGATRLRGVHPFATPTGYTAIGEKVVWPEPPVLDRIVRALDGSADQS